MRAGGRLTGRVGRYTLGALNIQSGDAEAAGTRATNFSVLRARRDILRRSSIGAMFTGRSVALDGLGGNEAYGVDGIFGFYDDLNINTHWARTRTDGRTGNDTSYRAHLEYLGDRYGVQLEHLLVGDDFNPEIGFVRRRDMRRSFGEFRFSPRPQSIDWVRRFLWTGSFAYVENLAGAVETRETLASFGIELDNSDQLLLSGMRSYEFLPRPFAISRDVTLPVRGYDFANLGVGYNFGQQRRWSANVLAEHGSFYSGQKTALTVTRGRASLTDQFSVEPLYSGQLDRSGGGRVHDQPARRAGHLYDDAADVHQRAGAVQLQPQRHVGQHPLPLGVPAGQRAVHRLQRGARYRPDPLLPGAHEPGVHHQVQPAVPVLTRDAGRIP